MADDRRRKSTSSCWETKYPLLRRNIPSSRISLPKISKPERTTFSLPKISSLLCSLAVLLAVVQLPEKVAAQKYNLEEVDVPPPKEAAALYAFFVFANKDSPEKLHERAKGYVAFSEPRLYGIAGTKPEDGRLHGPDGRLAAGSRGIGGGIGSLAKQYGPSDSTLAARIGEVPQYHGVQLTIMRYREYLKYFDSNNFCCTEWEARDGQCARTDGIKFSKYLPKSGLAKTSIGGISETTGATSSSPKDLLLPGQGVTGSPASVAAGTRNNGTARYPGVSKRAVGALFLRLS